MINNSYIFGKSANDDKPHLSQPEKGDKTCIRFSHCSYPKSCPVLVKQRREQAQAKRWEQS
jgi:hypothetical protein